MTDSSTDIDTEFEQLARLRELAASIREKAACAAATSPDAAEVVGLIDALDAVASQLQRQKVT